MFVGAAASQVIQNHLKQHTDKINTLLEQLSTGYRVNSAGDDPAGIAQINEYDKQARGMDAAYDNVQQGINLLSAGETGLNTILTQLQSFRTTALEASADGISDYSSYQTSAAGYKSAIDLAANTTVFNGNTLLDGSISGTFNIQVGPGTGAANQTDISGAISSTNTSAGLSLTTYDLSNQTNAQNAVTAIDTAIASVTGQLSTIGAFQNVLSAQADLLDAQRVNFESALSTVRNVDTAAATADLAKYQALQSSAAISLLSADSQTSLLNLLYG